MKKSISILLSLIMVLSASGLAPVAIPAVCFGLSPCRNSCCNRRYHSSGGN